MRPITLPTGEVKMRAVEAPPVESASDLLAWSLAEYAKSIEGLELLKSQAERARVEEDTLMNTVTSLSDNELGAKVIGLKRAQNIYAGREASREQALFELQTRIGTASQELTVLVREKRNRERELMARNAMAAYGVPAEMRDELFGRLVKRGDLDELELSSKPLEDIRALEPGAFYPGSAEGSVAYGKDLQAKFDGLKKI
jgi:hypothetical protein